MIKNNDKIQLKTETVYWSYYIDLFKKRNKIKNYTGIFQFTVVKKERETSQPDGYWFDFDIEGGKFSDTMKHNISSYMNGYGTAFCNFFKSYEECAKFHDEELKQYAVDLNTADRAAMYKRLIYKTQPKKSTLEIKAVEWLKSLTPTQKKYVEWIKRYYEE